MGAGTPGPNSPCMLCDEPREAPVHQKPDGWARMAAEVLVSPRVRGRFLGIVTDPSSGATSFSTIEIYF